MTTPIMPTPTMPTIDKSGTFTLGNRTVKRLGYGAMQLAGPGVFGPPRDHHAALAVLREAVACGVNHIDTSDFYGPHVTNQLIREALAPYPDDLLIVTKIGARRGADGSWFPAFSPEALTRAVHDNLRNLGLDVLDVVNLRIMFGVHEPAEGSIEAPLTVLAARQMASSSTPGALCKVCISIGTPGKAAEISRAARRPSIAGMARSRMMTSGRSSLALATASRPFSASPQTSHPSWVSSKARSMRRTVALSSAIRSRDATSTTSFRDPL